MNPFIFLRRLVFVPTCVICNERLSPFLDSQVGTHGKVCLCNDCYKKWREATGELCPYCSMPAYKCTCAHKSLKKEYSNFPSLFFYDSENDNAQNKIIYSLKRIRNKELTEFLAFELYPHLVDEIETRGISRDSLVFTWIPRRRSSIAKYGFDQGRELALALSRLFGKTPVPLFLRLGGKEQKKLDTERREQNLKKSVILNQNLSGFPLKESRGELKLVLKNKNIVIIDDVVTTGASMRRAVDLLKTTCKGHVIITSVARVIK